MHTGKMKKKQKQKKTANQTSFAYKNEISIGRSVLIIGFTFKRRSKRMNRKMRKKTKQQLLF